MAKVAVRRSVAPSSLLTGLVAYWQLDEASGTRYDAVGSNDLTPTNVTAVAGMHGNAVQVALATPGYLEQAAPSGILDSADGSFTVAVWANVATAGNYGEYRKIISYNEVLPAGESWATYGIEMMGAYNFDMAWIVGPGGAAQITHSAYTPGEWQLYIGWFDLANQLACICTNAGTPVTVAATHYAPPSGAIPFRLGAPTGGGSKVFDGMIDEVGIWSRVLTADERTALYNGGVGVTYPFTGV